MVVGVIVASISTEANDISHLRVGLEVLCAGGKYRAARSTHFETRGLPEGTTKCECFFISHKHMLIVEISGDKTGWPGCTDTR